LNDFREIMRELADSRELLTQLTLRDLRVRYKQAVFGVAWAIFIPVLIISASSVVRLAISQVSGSGLDQAALGAVTIKAIPWAFLVGALGSATSSLSSSRNLVSKVYFAREVLPISAVMAQGVDSAIGAVLVAALLPFLGGVASPALIWVPILVAILVLFTIGGALLLSCANLFFRDVKYIVQALTTFGIFFTPVLFEARMLGPTASRIIMFNPLSALFEGLTLVALRGHNLLTPLRDSGMVIWEPWYLAYATLWAVFAFVAGSLLFHRVEPVFAEYV
jgi:homopolymeric O-antigen transport system permease protein